jgi:pantoate--beta-alanine ligase
MEGRHRPGHFDGVAQVVVLLLRAVQPDLLLLGQKDFQQFRILQRVVEQAELPVRVEACPIVREPDGLAMSSRNRLLDPKARRQAVSLSAALFAAREQGRSASPQALERALRQELAKAEGIELEYAELVDTARLQPLEDWPEGDAVFCLAAWCGGVRLIDNVLIPA